MSDMAKSMPEAARTRSIAVDEYYRMVEVGILRPDERVELLNGRIFEMPPIGAEHALVVELLHDAFRTALRDRAATFAQRPAHLDGFSEPRPDVMVVRGPRERYWGAHPVPADALLVIEVSQSTLTFDRGEKLQAYARAGIPEYWIVDLVHERLLVYTHPEGNGYASQRIAGRGERMAPSAFPDASIAVSDILRPPSSRTASEG
jgi:Uma2 family endonuclease